MTAEIGEASDCLGQVSLMEKVQQKCGSRISNDVIKDRCCLFIKGRQEKF